MPRYTAHLTNSCERDFKRMGKEGKVILSRVLDQVEVDPHQAGERLRGAMRGLYSLHLRTRSGEVRVAYAVWDEMEAVLLFCAGPRENFYDRARRRADALDMQWQRLDLP